MELHDRTMQVKNFPSNLRPVISSCIARHLIIIIALLLSGCQSAPDPQPCDCGVAEKELRAYTLKYFDALESVGVLRHELKACSERR